VDHRVVTGELECDGVGVAAHDCGLRAAELSRRLGQTRLAGDDTGAFGGKGNFELGLAGDRTQASRDRALERLGRGFLRRISGPDVRRHHSVTGIQLSATLTDDSGNSTPKQR
jgi:hypothetical protein